VLIVGRVNFYIQGKEIPGNRGDSCLLVFNDPASKGWPKVSWKKKEEFRKEAE